MIESMCAELLLTGLLHISGEKVKVDSNNVHYVYRDNSTYVIPKDSEIAIKKCGSVKFTSDVSEKMSLFIKK